MVSLFVLGCTSKAPAVVPQPAAYPEVPAVSEPVTQEPAVEETAPAEETETASENVVEITSSGFTPKTFTIQAGEIVTFVNKDSSTPWPASNVHPTHTTYPGSNRNKCGTTDEATIFDACKGLAEGEEYSFTFTKVGIWPYHDHLNPSKGGVVVVK